MLKELKFGFTIAAAATNENGESIYVAAIPIATIEDLLSGYESEILRVTTRTTCSDGTSSVQTSYTVRSIVKKEADPNKPNPDFYVGSVPPAGRNAVEIDYEVVEGDEGDLSLVSDTPRGDIYGINPDVIAERHDDLRTIIFGDYRGIMNGSN